MAILIFGTFDISMGYLIAFEDHEKCRNAMVRERALVEMSRADEQIFKYNCILITMAIFQRKTPDLAD